MYFYRSKHFTASRSRVEQFNDIFNINVKIHSSTGSGVNWQKKTRNWEIFGICFLFRFLWCKAASHLKTSCDPFFVEISMCFIFYLSILNDLKYQQIMIFIFLIFIIMICILKTSVWTQIVLSIGIYFSNKFNHLCSQF